MSDGGESQQQTDTTNGGGEGAPQIPDWMAGLPDDLKADQTLGRYKSLEDLAKGHLETKRVASSKVVVPGADADAAAWDAFYSQIGRPAEASAYDVPATDDTDPAYIDAFKGKAHAIGLHPNQAKALAEWQNEQVAASIKTANDASAAELAAFKTETPEYDAKLAKAQALLKATGVDEAVLTELDVKLGTRNLLSFVFGLADKFGETARVDPDNPNAMPFGADTANAAEQLRKLNGDEGFRAKINAGDTAAIAMRQRLIAAANQQSHKPG